MLLLVLRNLVCFQKHILKYSFSQKTSWKQDRSLLKKKGFSFILWILKEFLKANSSTKVKKKKKGENADYIYDIYDIYHVYIWHIYDIYEIYIHTHDIHVYNIYSIYMKKDREEHALSKTHNQNMKVIPPSDSAC